MKVQTDGIWTLEIHVTGTCYLASSKNLRASSPLRVPRSRVRTDNNQIEHFCAQFDTAHMRHTVFRREGYEKPYYHIG